MPSLGNNTAAHKIGLRQGRFSSLAFFMNNQSFSVLSLVAILGFLYGKTLASGLTWANGGTDGGDLISAAAVQGVAHPGGYPLYLLLAQVFQTIIPGNLAFRTNILSAVCMILAVLIVFSSAYQLLHGKPFAGLAAWSAALAFGISPLVWSQAVITEVYALQTLLTVVIVRQSLSAGSKWNNDLLRGFIAGLSLGNNLTSVFLLPLLLWDGNSPCQDLKKHLGKRFGGLVAGSLIYIFLPLWASGQPPINWGNPVTLSAFFNLLTGRLYQSNFTDLYALDRLRGLIGVFLAQVGLPGLFITAFHLFGGWKIIKETIPLLWVFIIYSIFSLFYGTIDSYVYLIPCVMVLCLWIAEGLQEIIQIMGSRWKNAWIPFGVLIMAALTAQVIQTIPRVDASRDTRAETFGQSLMRKLPKNAIVFTADDETTFTLWYFHYGLDQRADLAVIAQGLLRFDWYRETLRSTYPNLFVPDGNHLSAGDVAAANPERPFCLLSDHQPIIPTTCSNGVTE